MQWKIVQLAHQAPDTTDPTDGFVGCVERVNADPIRHAVRLTPLSRLPSPGPGAEGPIRESVESVRVSLVLLPGRGILQCAGTE